ncbi:MAG: tail fiber protein [Candidatus Baltobacteraceae bacterium]
MDTTSSYIGEIRMFGFNFAPLWWAPCDGRLLPINDNQALFQLIGTTFGGDGKTDFAVPDLRGMVAPLKSLTFCIAFESVYPDTREPDPNAPDPNANVPSAFVNEVRMFGFNAAPLGWDSCDGRLLRIAQNPALFSLIGNTYGGDGITNFALPDLRGMVAPFNKPLTLNIALNAAFPQNGGPVDGRSLPMPYIGEVRMFGSNLVPLGWSPCDGRLLSLDPYQSLFSLLGTTFGGDGKTGFAVPDLRGMVAPFKPLTFCIATGYILSQGLDGGGPYGMLPDRNERKH